ncbi:hypothetical protein BTJ39_09010 [Izhakiella australiensis]|uniref:Fimbrial-type adhesion domain-containing protein n=2 Tax=Izhakiella australiensis TaxID=1926881 RepID=A0A1S8YNH4_9GAMM|nr:hypothetical protein BTJ39_09010 [Izhakiella australiensis]
MNNGLIRGLLFVFLFSPVSVKAWMCYPTDSPRDIAFFLSGAIGHGNNYVGSIVTIPERKNNSDMTVTCPLLTLRGVSFRSYLTDLPISTEIDNYSYLSINDYLDAAVSVTNASVGTFYPPVKYLRFPVDSQVRFGRSFPVSDNDITVKLRVKRKISNNINVQQMRLFSVYITTTRIDPLLNVIYSVSLGGEIKLPGTCVINAGSTISFNFGDIDAAEFVNTEVGNRPQGVNPQWKSIGIKCSNTEQQALMTMRLEGAKTAGNALVSSNPDLGFVIADERGRPLRPNDPNSVIPFRLGATSAQVKIGAWPVSLTGLKPAAGRFTSHGYIRVDFE